MIDSHREQRPLLCDDFTDEDVDVKSYYHKSRNRPSVCSGRARNYAKGAAAVLTQWPDNCSTSVAFWWLAVSMITVTIFVVYNSVLIFGMIPASDMKPPTYRTFNNEIKLRGRTFSASDVYMHLFVNNSEDVVLHNYLGYATNLSNQFPSFKYNLLIVMNDTSNDLHKYKDKERNEIAFNSLWTNENLSKQISKKYNISVEYISLSAYLNDSPIKKFWRHLPSHLIEFLVRSVSIWEKGGVAFNPNILIPKLYNAKYVDKLYDILNDYSNSSSKSDKKKIKTRIYEDSNTKRPNNIQDIIMNLEKEDNNISNIDLSEAENKDVVDILNTQNILKLKRASFNDTNSSVHNTNENLNEKKFFESNSTNSTHGSEYILPLFLKYIFEDKSKKEMLSNKPDLLKIPNKFISSFHNFSNDNQKRAQPIKKNFKSSKEDDTYNNTSANHKSSKILKLKENSQALKRDRFDNIFELSMDIKGNIIASKTACHAFLGTMFSNVIQHTEEETLTEFIISELSLFCEGLLTSCAGVNVILV